MDIAFEDVFRSYKQCPAVFARVEIPLKDELV